jgi:hypothetical protein
LVQYTRLLPFLVRILILPLPLPHLRIPVIVPVR